MIDQSLRSIFGSRVESASECWLWRAYTDRDGYGRIRYGGRPGALAHRVAFEVVRGPIPRGLVIDHLCRNRACVNPWHMETVTPAENTRRGTSLSVVNAAKTHCPAGHPYDEANTYVYMGPGNRRRCCRLCNREAARRSKARRALLEAS